jgi:hypothetical protein
MMLQQPSHNESAVVSSSQSHEVEDETHAMRKKRQRRARTYVCAMIQPLCFTQCGHCIQPLVTSASS